MPGSLQIIFFDVTCSPTMFWAVMTICSRSGGAVESSFLSLRSEMKKLKIVHCSLCSFSMMIKWANDGLLQANDCKMLVNDGEMLVNNGIKKSLVYCVDQKTKTNRIKHCQLIFFSLLLKTGINKVWSTVDQKKKTQSRPTVFKHCQLIFTHSLTQNWNK